MTDYTPTHNLPMPQPTDRIADEAGNDSIRHDIRSLALAVARELVAMEVETSDGLAGKVSSDAPGIPYIAADGDSIVLTDRSRRHSWLGADRKNGGPTDWAVKLFGDRTGYQIRHSDQYAFAFSDASGRLSDLTLRKSDGQFEDFVIERIRNRIGAAGGFLGSDRYVRGEEVLPVATDMSIMPVWGSSSGAGISGHLTNALLAEGWDVELSNESKAGEQSQQIFARMGATPAKISFPSNTIPTSGSVTVTTNIPGYQLKPYEGVVSGVHGTLSWQDNVFTFTRTGSGDPVPSPASSAFIPEVDTRFRGAVNLLWAGKNDSPADWQGTIQRTDQAFDWLSPLVRRTLVLGHFADRDDTVGSATWNKVRDVNAAHKARYGVLFVDVREYLASPQLWADSGISPTELDLIAQANFVKPPSVSSDSGHLNAAGYKAVSAFIIRHIRSLGWY